MKRILLITCLIVGLMAAYSFAQMGQGMMGGQSQQQPGETATGRSPYGKGVHSCQQMMGPGMMGYGGCGMMGPGMMGHMGGIMGRSHIGGMMGHGGCGMMGPGMRGHMGGMMGPGMMGYGGYGSQDYDPEAFQKYLDDTADLRKKLHNKKFEYFETVRKPDANRETVMKLEKEILDLKWEIYEKAPR